MKRHHGQSSNVQASYISVLDRFCRYYVDVQHHARTSLSQASVHYFNHHKKCQFHASLLPSSLTGLRVPQITSDRFHQHHHSPTLAIDDGFRSKYIQESVCSVRVRVSHLKLISCQRPQYSFHVRIENRVSTQRFLPVLRFDYRAVAIVNYKCQAAENDVSIGKFCSILMYP